VGRKKVLSLSKPKEIVTPVAEERDNRQHTLQEAIRPFAAMFLPGDGDNHCADAVICCRGEFKITYGDLARAHTALTNFEL